MRKAVELVAEKFMHEAVNVQISPNVQLRKAQL